MSVTFTEGRTQKPPFQGFRARRLADQALANTPATFSIRDFVLDPRVHTAHSLATAGLLVFVATRKSLPVWARLAAGLLAVGEGFRIYFDEQYGG